MQAEIRDVQTLRRIVAMLISLAALAERVAGLSFPVRWLVLGILRPAEAVAGEFVAQATHIPPPAADETPSSPNSPADAILLAWRFRVLAAMLGLLTGAVRRSVDWNARGDGAPRRLAPRHGQLPITPGGWTREPNDTS